MDEKLLEVKSKQAGRIFRCCHGTFHMQLKNRGITLHLSEEAFLDFARMVGEMYSKVFDEELSKLFREGKNEEEHRECKFVPELSEHVKHLDNHLHEILAHVEEEKG